MFQTGDQIGSYTLLEKLGRGAFGEVWLAEEKTAISSHRFALKLPNEEDVDLEAIRQEADVWEQVKGHPNILPIIKADIFDGQIYIASEYAPDGSLGEWLKKHDGKAPSFGTAVRMIKGILAGLEHLHSRGVIHRDLKPANILLQSETPRIADFGIARLAKSDATNSALSAGTPSYMAPECFYSVRSEQTDIWAVGVLFHKLLSGKLPFSQPDQISVMNAVLNGEPEIDREIPEDLRRIISRTLQKETSQRYQSAAEMHEALNDVSFGEMAGDASISQRSMPAAPPIPEKEEETVVSAKPAPVPPAAAAAAAPPIQYRQIERPASGGGKTLAIALASFLVLAALTAWAALQFGGDEPAAPQTSFSDLSNGANLNANLSNIKSDSGTLANFAKTNDGKRIQVNPSANTSVENFDSVPEDQAAESNSSAVPSATPYDIERDDTVPSINARGRVPRTEPTPADGEGAAPPKTPAATPTAGASPAVRPKTPKPTPKASEKPEETPPVMEKNDAGIN